MKEYEDQNFEFRARNITFHDRVDERWEEDETGVLVEEVKSGSWAALGALSVGDLIVRIDNDPIPDVAALKGKMEQISKTKPRSIVFMVRRGIYYAFLEIEPQWNHSKKFGKE